MTDDLFLQPHEIRALSQDLKKLAQWMCNALDATLSRQVVFNDSPQRSEDPVVFNENASEVAHDLRGTLRTWTEHICTHSTLQWPGELRSKQYAVWIDRYLVDLAKTEEAQTAADEITYVIKRVQRTIDRPEVPRFIGPCQSATDGITCEGVYCHAEQLVSQCLDCGVTIDIPAVRATTEEVMRAHLFDKRELLKAMVMVAKESVPRQMVDNWIRRGRLTDHGGKYKLDEAMALWENRRKRSA